MSFSSISSTSKSLYPKSIRIGLVDPNIAQTWAQRILSDGTTVASIKKGDTINHTTSQPIATGLFCQRIFGPCIDYTCACGHEKIRIHKNVNVSPPVCPECHVEWTESSVRRQRLGSIELISPVTHKWFSDSRNYIPILSGITVKTFKGLKECKLFFPFPFHTVEPKKKFSGKITLGVKTAQNQAGDFNILSFLQNNRTNQILQFLGHQSSYNRSLNIRDTSFLNREPLKKQFWYSGFMPQGGTTYKKSGTWPKRPLPTPTSKLDSLLAQHSTSSARLAQHSASKSVESFYTWIDTLKILKKKSNKNSLFFNSVITKKKKNRSNLEDFGVDFGKSLLAQHSTGLGALQTWPYVQVPIGTAARHVEHGPSWALRDDVQANLVQGQPKPLAQNQPEAKTLSTGHHTPTNEKKVNYTHSLLEFKTTSLRVKKSAQKKIARYRFLALNHTNMTNLAFLESKSIDTMPVLKNKTNSLFREEIRGVSEKSLLSFSQSPVTPLNFEYIFTLSEKNNKIHSFQSLKKKGKPQFLKNFKPIEKNGRLNGTVLLTKNNESRTITLWPQKQNIVTTLKKFYGLAFKWSKTAPTSLAEIPRTKSESIAWTWWCALGKRQSRLAEGLTWRAWQEGQPSWWRESRLEPVHAKHSKPLLSYFGASPLRNQEGLPKSQNLPLNNSNWEFDYLPTILLIEKAKRIDYILTTVKEQVDRIKKFKYLGELKTFPNRIGSLPYGYNPLVKPLVSVIPPWSTKGRSLIAMSSVRQFKRSHSLYGPRFGSIDLKNQDGPACVTQHDVVPFLRPKLLLSQQVFTTSSFDQSVAVNTIAMLKALRITNVQLKAVVENQTSLLCGTLNETFRKLKSRQSDKKSISLTSTCDLISSSMSPNEPTQAFGQRPHQTVPYFKDTDLIIKSKQETPVPASEKQGDSSSSSFNLNFTSKLFQKASKVVPFEIMGVIDQRPLRRNSLWSQQGSHPKAFVSKKGTNWSKHHSFPIRPSFTQPEDYRRQFIKFLGSNGLISQGDTPIFKYITQNSNLNNYKTKKGITKWHAQHLAPLEPRPSWSQRDGAVHGKHLSYASQKGATKQGHQSPLEAPLPLVSTFGTTFLGTSEAYGIGSNLAVLRKGYNLDSTWLDPSGQATQHVQGGPPMDVYFSEAKSFAKEDRVKHILTQTGGGALQNFLEFTNLNHCVLLLQNDLFEIAPRLDRSQSARRVLLQILNDTFNELNQTSRLLEKKKISSFDPLGASQSPSTTKHSTKEWFRDKSLSQKSVDSLLVSEPPLGPEGAVVATNSSSLGLGILAKHSTWPQRGLALLDAKGATKIDTKTTGVEDKASKRLNAAQEEIGIGVWPQATAGASGAYEAQHTQQGTNSEKSTQDKYKTYYKSKIEDLEKKYKDLKKEYKAVKKICTDFQNRKNVQKRRYKLAFQLLRTLSNPAGMTLSSVPVLPPGLRPIIDVPKIGPITADLNIRYRGLIFALRNLRELAYVDFRNTGAAQASVQEAVDDLLYTGGKTRKDKAIDRSPNLYKSLAMRLKGKHGRFRGNLLGKRVDYSGRSVIVVGPTLKIHQCGLPFEIATKLFNPFLIRRLIQKGLCKNVYKAKQILISGKFKPLIWTLCREVMLEHLVLLNRAPTLHRLGVQAFMPILISGRAILLHPLVCTGFNADFDGDQMGVHIPLFPKARAEAWKMMWSRNNFLAPSSGEPILLPSQDMVLGCYYLTEMCLGIKPPPSFRYFYKNRTNGIKVSQRTHTLVGESPLSSSGALLRSLTSKAEALLVKHSTGLTPSTGIKKDVNSYEVSPNNRSPYSALGVFGASEAKRHGPSAWLYSSWSQKDRPLASEAPKEPSARLLSYASQKGTTTEGYQSYNQPLLGDYGLWPKPLEQDFVAKKHGQIGLIHISRSPNETNTSVYRKKSDIFITRPHWSRWDQVKNNVFVDPRNPILFYDTKFSSLSLKSWLVAQKIKVGISGAFDTKTHNSFLVPVLSKHSKASLVGTLWSLGTNTTLKRVNGNFGENLSGVGLKGPQGTTKGQAKPKVPSLWCWWRQSSQVLVQRTTVTRPITRSHAITGTNHPNVFLDAYNRGILNLQSIVWVNSYKIRDTHQSTEIQPSKNNITSLEALNEKLDGDGTLIPTLELRVTPYGSTQLLQTVGTKKGFFINLTLVPLTKDTKTPFENACVRTTVGRLLFNNVLQKADVSN